MRGFVSKISVTVFGCLVGTALTIIPSMTVSGSHNAVGLLVTVGIAGTGDTFRNWDFHSTSDTAYNVDWPATIVFWNAADVVRVKSFYQNDLLFYGASCASPMRFRMNDQAPSWIWDIDSGVKDICVPGCYVASVHMRIYAPNPPDWAYNAAWGYYVFATTHRDVSEVEHELNICPFVDDEYGWSEDAENIIANLASNTWGWTVNHDSLTWFNALPGVQYGPHYAQNSGTGTKIRLP